MNVLSACLIVTIVAGTVESHRGYSLIPPNTAMISTDSFVGAVSEAFKNSQRIMMESRKSTETMNSEESLPFILSRLANLISNEQRNIERIDGPKTAPSYRYHQLHPAAHRRLVRQVRPVTPEGENDRADPVTRQIPNHQVRPISNQRQYLQVQPMNSDSGPVTYRPMFQAVAVTPEMF